MIQVENLTKYYGEYAAIENVSFAVEKGEILGFLGPNAAGKTTTMRILTGFLQPTSGKAAVAGFDVVSQSLEARKRIGYLPENVPLYDDMSPRSYLQYAARLKGVESRQVNKRVEEVMEATRITDHAEVLISKLSKGYRQRVGLARALIHNPMCSSSVSTVGLDPNQIVNPPAHQGPRRRPHDHLEHHILPEVEMLCGRIVIIHEGKVAAMDTPDNLALRLRRAQQIGVHVRGPEREKFRPNWRSAGCAARAGGARRRFGGGAACGWRGEARRARGPGVGDSWQRLGLAPYGRGWHEPGRSSGSSRPRRKELQREERDCDHAARAALSHSLPPLPTAWPRSSC